MIDLPTHLQDNQDRIESEAREYAKQYGISYERALREVNDEYIQGYHDELDWMNI